MLQLDYLWNGNIDSIYLIVVKRKWVNIYKVIWTMNNIDISKSIILFPYLSNFLFEKKNNPLPPALLDPLKRTQHRWCYCDDCQARLLMSCGWTGWCQHPASGKMEPQHFRLLQVELGSRQWQQEHLVTKCCIPVSLVSVESCEPAPSSSTVVCKMNDEYSRHSDIYQVFASQLTMQNQMIQMR